MSRDNILSLLGLSLRGGNLAVGEEPVEAVARARDARVLLVASDAAAGTCRRVAHFAEAGQCLWLPLPYTKAELGQCLGRSAVAVAAVTDVGLASALARKLAQRDPERYSGAAQRLELKAQRAAERRTEQQAHEKNVRTGKRKPKKAPPPEKPEQCSPRKSRTSGRPAGAAAPPQKSGTPDRPAGDAAPAYRKSRPSKENRPKPRATPYAHSRPVKKGKGSFRKKAD